jgi:hypothetical protein
MWMVGSRCDMMTGHEAITGTQEEQKVILGIIVIGEVRKT